MIVGIPKEIKNNENRVGITESGVQSLTKRGHEVLVENNAGVGSGISNEQYSKVGATIIKTKSELYKRSNMIVKVKEPLAEEYELLEQNQILYCYLHLAAEPKLAEVLCKRKIKSIAYETIEDKDGKLPLLVPMSEVAGRLATQIGASLLQKNFGGMGVLLGGVTGVRRAKVAIIGGGVVGVNALQVAFGLGGDVTVLDINHSRLEYLDHIYKRQITTLYSNYKNIARAVKDADLLIGAVLITGHKAPCLVTKEMVEEMEPGSVVVDVDVDQGGCIETCKPTSHEKPTYTHNGVLHYCVPNIPGITPRTSTYALANATSRYMYLLADHGVETLIRKDQNFRMGLNTYAGSISYKPVADALDMEYVPPNQ